MCGQHLDLLWKDTFSLDETDNISLDSSSLVVSPVTGKTQNQNFSKIHCSNNNNINK